MDISNEGAARIALRGRDSKGKTCFLLYSVDGTLIDSGTITDGAFDYNKSPDGYVIVSLLLTSTSADEGTLAPTDWNTDVDLERLRLAKCVLIADKSVNIVDALKVATKLDDLAPVSWCVVIGTPPPGSVEGKTTFFISDAPDANLKAVADPIVDKNDERVFILSNGMCGMLGTIAAQYTQEELVNRLIALSTPYEGRDEERAQELISKLAARRDSPIGENDERIKKVLPPRLREYAVKLAGKFNTSVYTAFRELELPFCAKQGHHRAKLERGGSDISTYMAIRHFADSGVGKTGLTKFALDPLISLQKAEAKRQEGDKIKIPALKAVFDETEKRHKAATLALEAAKHGGDSEDIKRADEAEKEALCRLRKASAEYWKVAAPPHVYILHWSSDKGVDWELSQNEWAAKLQGKTPDGAIVIFSEGSDVFGMTRGVNTTKRDLNALSRLLDTKSNGGFTVTHESPSQKYGLQTIGACVSFEEQPGTDETVKFSSIAAQGGLNRMLGASTPNRPPLPDLCNPIYLKERWGELFFVDLKVDRLQLDDEAQQIYIAFREELVRRREIAFAMDDKQKMGFLAKLDEYVLRDARCLHLIKEADRILADGNDLVKVLIDGNTMREAVEISLVTIDERDKSHDICRRERKTLTSDLSLDAQNIYQHQIEHARGEWTERSRFAANVPKLNLWTKKNRERADSAEKELVDAGLWIIGEYGQKKDRRRAITLDEIAAPEKTDEIPF